MVLDFASYTTFPRMSLLDLTDNGYTACVRLSQGNPGAVTAVVLLLKHAGAADLSVPHVAHGLCQPEESDGQG